jgi:hypothetical protein
MMRFLALLLLAGCVTTGAPAPRADANERAAVLAAVHALTESWRTANPALAEGVLHPDFRLTTLQGPPENRRLHVVAREGLVSAAANLAANDWDDRLHDTEVRIDPNGHALVWSRYSFFVDNGQPGHCGYVLIDLYRMPDGWKILSFADTHNNLDGRPEAEVCP